MGGEADKGGNQIEKDKTRSPIGRAATKSESGIPLKTVATVLALLIALVAAIGLWRLGSNASKQACIAQVAQEYPGVPVSAFDSQETGALKLSYDSERRKAVQEC